MKLLGYFVGKAISGIFHVYVVVERERESLHALPIQTSVRYFMNLKKKETSFYLQNLKSDCLPIRYKYLMIIFTAFRRL